MQVRLLWLRVFCTLGPMAVHAALPPVSAPRFVSEDEIAALEHDLVLALAANAKRAFPPPALRHSEPPDPAEAHQLRLLQPTGPLADCARRFGGLSAAERTRTEMTPALAELEARCGARVAAAFASAGSHPQAGSVLRVGRSQNVDLRPFVHLTRLAGIHASGLLVQRRSAEALHTLLDVLTVAQDLTRGGVTLITRFIVSSGARQALDRARAALDGGVFASAELDRLVARTAALQADFPGFESVLRAESIFMALISGMRPLQPRDWSPPGGRPDFGAELPRDFEGVPEPSSYDPRDAFALTALGYLRKGEALGRACAPTAPAVACVRALEDLAAAQEARRADAADAALHHVDALSALAADPGASLEQVLDAAVESVHRGADPAEVRERVVSALADGYLADVSKQAADAAEWQAELTSLRLRLEERRDRARTAPIDLTNPAALREH
jgi:hypothetical protein